MKPTVRRFHQLLYRAREWSRSRKIVARVEATALGTDVRFIVTNLGGRGKTLYEKVFCARGNAENLIKDMKRFTRSDKTACSRWQANQFRLFLHMGAYFAAAQPAGRGTEKIALARRDIRDDPAHVREARGARRGVEGQDQGGIPGQLSARGDARSNDRRYHDTRPLTSAAHAARAPSNNLERVQEPPRSHRRQPGRRLTPEPPQITNKRG
jgi:hypothetical protein